ncbi:MAG: pentapeptide repeat-containing protein [Candidatus Cloacimonadaceae bacterium]
MAEQQELYRQKIIELDSILTADWDFTQCIFSGCDLSDYGFNGILDECRFEDCNLSLTTFKGAKLQGVKFLRCKLMGINFTEVSSLGLALEFAECLIRSCNFNNLPLPKTAFHQCEIIETDFMGTRLAGSSFAGSTFRLVTFHNTDLNKADFSTAQGYLINPLNNQIKDALFSLPEAVSLLQCMGVKLK